jgi:hypothetical protein
MTMRPLRTYCANRRRRVRTYCPTILGHRSSRTPKYSIPTGFSGSAAPSSTRFESVNSSVASTEDPSLNILYQLGATPLAMRIV